MDRYAPSSASLEKIEGVLPNTFKVRQGKENRLEKAFMRQVGARKS